MELHEDDAGLRVRVIDQGQGFAPEFLPFVSTGSRRASNRHRGGLGLGLSIVQQLVDAHGGSVAVTSAGVGRGATFEIRLPRDGAPAPG